MEARAVFRRLVGDILSLRRQVAVLVASLVLLAGARLLLTWLVKILSDDLLAQGADARLGRLIGVASLEDRETRSPFLQNRRFFPRRRADCAREAFHRPRAHSRSSYFG